MMFSIIDDMDKRERDYSIDFVKGVAILFVILLHNMPNESIYSIAYIGQAVPLFLLVSSYLTYGGFQVKAIVTDKLLGKLIHGYIAALVLILDELGNVLSHHKILVVSVLGSVLAYTLGKGCVLLVESSEQGLVFGAYALIGVSHHFSGNERLTVGKSLVMLGDLSLDVVERKIHLLGFLTLAYGSVALGIPDSLGNALLATELCNSSVDCHTSHDRDNSVSLLASIYIEDCLESASHNSYFFVRCKIKL